MADEIRELSLGTQKSSSGSMEALQSLEATSDKMTESITTILQLISETRSAMQAVNSNGGAMIWFANSSMFSDMIYSYGYHNYYALAKLVYENCSIEAPIDVVLKPLTSGTTLTVTEADEVLWSAIYIVVIPVGTLIAGFVVWFIRRRR